MKRLYLVVAITLITSAALATTWGKSTKVDPITQEEVECMDVESAGDYIYGWPSKFDLVFWPFTAPQWIIMNEKTGYAAFNPDFESLPADEIAPMKEWLAKNYDPANPPKTHFEKLLWLEKVYAQRKMNDDFWSYYYRLMAYLYSEEKNDEKSLEYVKKALPVLETKLKAAPKGFDRIQVLYLLGEYNRRLGEKEKAKMLFDEAKNTIFKDKDGAEITGHPYINGIIKNREDIMVGRKLDQ